MNLLTVDNFKKENFNINCPANSPVKKELT